MGWVGFKPRNMILLCGLESSCEFVPILSKAMSCGQRVKWCVVGFKPRYRVPLSSLQDQGVKWCEFGSKSRNRVLLSRLRSTPCAVSLLPPFQRQGRSRGQEVKRREVAKTALYGLHNTQHNLQRAVSPVHYIENYWTVTIYRNCRGRHFASGAEAARRERPPSPLLRWEGNCRYSFGFLLRDFCGARRRDLVRHTDLRRVHRRHVLLGRHPRPRLRPAERSRVRTLNVERWKFARAGIDLKTLLAVTFEDVTDCWSFGIDFSTIARVALELPDQCGIYDARVHHLPK